MDQHRCSPRHRTVGLLVLGAMCLAGCADETPQPKPLPQQYDVIAPKTGFPDYMKGTVWEKTDLGNTDFFQVSGYGLVVNLDNTGDTTAPMAVREYMVKEMVKHGYGSKLMPGWEKQSPERILSDRRVAIVQVIGMLPPGVRKGQSFDVIVQCIPKNTTSSLAGGELYRTDLKINGADPQDPFSKINDYASAKGFLSVNPAYALTRDEKPSKAVLNSLRNAVLMDGGVVKYDRPLFLRLRNPENRVARYIEQRIIDRFQDKTVAAAHDGGVIQIYVPYDYHGDWDRFSKLVTHVYLDGSPAHLAAMASKLAAAARKPNAMLEDISYCFEGIGPTALPMLTPLLTDKRPEVVFAAARAAVYIGDPSGAATLTLFNIARDSRDPFQLNAVEALGGLPPSSSVNQMMRELLDNDRNIIRIAAYKVLARNHDPSIISRVVTGDPSNQKYILDIVPSRGAPIIYASRTGMPRIAIIGAMPEVTTPIMFSTMNERLTISSTALGQTLMLYYRSAAATDSAGRVYDQGMADPVKQISNPDVSELVKRLGGICNEDEKPLNFSYSEVVAIVQKLSEEKRLVAIRDGEIQPALFLLETPSSFTNAIYSAPSLQTGRPQAADGDGMPSSTTTGGVSRRDMAADAALATQEKH